MYTVQNKVLPGAYINFVSAARASATLGDRGTAAFPLSLDWGPENEVVTIENSEFQKGSLALTGYAYTADELRPLREIFANAKTLHLFRLNSGGAKAACKYAEAKYPGKIGNELKIVIQQNEGFTASTNEVYDVSTYIGTTLVDTQKAVKAVSDLSDNDYLHWKGSEALTENAGLLLTGGTTGAVQDAAYQTFLDKIEPYSFNAVGCDTKNSTVKGLFANWTRRLRDEQGVKFQCVLHGYPAADYEGVISVKNGLVGASDDPSAVYWTTGAESACAVNRSMTNSTYTGEYDIDTNYTQTQLEKAIKAGEFTFHRVGDQTRVLDQIANDIASMFNSKYLGKVQNDASGRVSLWSDIVAHHTQLQTIRAIENFDSSSVTVSQGDMKKSVAVEDHVQPVSAMEQLYMKVIVE